MSSPTSELMSTASDLIVSDLTASAAAASDSVEVRRQIALTAAEQCRQILIQEFKATEVIVFGSLRGDTPWHDRSDLDLAVRGIARDLIFEAYRRLEDVVPRWLSFDLVAIERADQEVRDRILQLTPIPENIFLNTKIRLEDELRAIEKTVATLEAVLAQAQTTPKIVLAPALASHTEDFYSGCERLSERVAVTCDQSLPKGSNWHEALLAQVSTAGGQNRPPLWNESTSMILGEYRRFRHRDRHLYNINLDDEKVLELASAVPKTFEQVKQCVAAFSAWLVDKSNS